MTEANRQAEDGTTLTPGRTANPRRVLGVFAGAATAVLLLFGVTIFYTLPSNVLSQRDDDSAVREAVRVLAAQQFGYFTKDQRGDQAVVYRLDGNGTIHNLMKTPQNLPSNLFGWSRIQRAQGPEVADLLNFNPDLQWRECNSAAEACIKTNADMPSTAATTKTHRHTICGEVYVVVERTVDWSFRKLVDYDRRAVRVSHVDVAC
ncbi:SdpA family antimicrobial peptide system protein [Gordonia sp. VNQ95]|uniref:SdpA family antimicrobial peptide system protein n=1 Tax=Gordonia TaxID=2053 RepID=UPI0032B3F774